MSTQYQYYDHPSSYVEHKSSYVDHPSSSYGEHYGGYPNYDYVPGYYSYQDDPRHMYANTDNNAPMNSPTESYSRHDSNERRPRESTRDSMVLAKPRSSEMERSRRSDDKPKSESLRPGPLAPSMINLALPLDHTGQAHHFVNNELKHLRGKVHVLFESVRKFGRFSMMDAEVEGQETMEECIEGLSRLWQMGDGYISILFDISSRGYASMRMFHTEKNNYAKLSPSECEKMVKADPFWEEERRNYDIRFM